MNTEIKHGKTGGCLCGDIRYLVTSPKRSITYCHCSQCRRTSGHFLAGLTIAKEELVIEADKNLEWFASSDYAHRGFCRRCGSSLFWQAKDSDEVTIMAGTLDQSDGLVEGEHIYVSDKGQYYELTDNIPKLSKYY